LGGGPLTTTAIHLDIGVHDPSMIWDGSKYYLFATGGTLSVRDSADILTWSGAGSVFASVPAWVSAVVGSTVTDLWAPDISYFNGLFHVYYAGSTFGSNKSVIGLATSTSLQSPSFTDEGLIVQSVSSDDYNAIDPNVTFDQNCDPWLAFGSFWSGIKLRKLDATTGKLATDDTTLYSIASRPNNGGAIEAASIISHNGYYYLFASFDACCKGVNSTYNTNYGRATKITGPYANKAGTDMMQGGAELLLSTSGRYIGPGGGTAWKDGDNYLYVYHYYDGQANGASKLQIRTINFDASDWITLGDPLFP
jgi:arabinan endo-1,5-alpha-L-arabinosidase